MRLTIALEIDPIEREPRPRRSVTQLVLLIVAERFCASLFIQLVGFSSHSPSDQLCADLFHEGGVFGRVIHMHAGRNLEVDAPDRFFRALGLPGILKIQINILFGKKFAKNMGTN